MAPKASRLVSGCSQPQSYNTEPGTSPFKASRCNGEAMLTPKLQEAREELRNMMHGKINIVDYPTFMKHFFPKSKGTPNKSSPNIFAHPPAFGSESEMYPWLTSTINGSNLFQQFVTVSTPYKSDPADPSSLAVDCGMYHKDLPPEWDGDAREKVETENRRVNWSRIEVSIECKSHATDTDPFDDRPNYDGEPLAMKRQETLGQILSYAELIFRHQQRTFHYMLLFLGRRARIVRFDRSGIYVTTKFDYTVDGSQLTDFLLRYCRRQPANRGLDPSATRIEPWSELGKKMRAWGAAKAEKNTDDHVQELFNASLDASWPWWQLEVHVEAKGRLKRSEVSKMEVRRFVVGKPHFCASGVAGRGTRGYVGVRLDEDGNLEGECVYLKDAWRVDHEGIEQEGAVLKELNAHKVSFVPTLICHGDLPGQVAQSHTVWMKIQAEEEEKEKTKGKEKAKGTGNEHEEGVGVGEEKEETKKKECPMKRHQHYRLVVKEVGKPLDRFKDGEELVKAIFCCIVAHEKAYALGIMHRDISAGNILLYKTEKGQWVGLLNDWELSKVVGSAARQPDRTGTWQFMSAHALNDPTWDIMTQDELESLFHVLLYYAIRFLPHNLAAKNVGQFLADYFDGYATHADGYRCGTAKFNAMEKGKISLQPYNGNKNATLKFFLPVAKNDPHTKLVVHPINSVFTTLLSWFQGHYYVTSGESESEEPATDGVSAEERERKAAIYADLDPDGAYDTSSSNLNHSNDYVWNTASSATNSGPKPSMPQMLELASNLKSHSGMKKLLMECSSSRLWPKDDKGEDLKPRRAVKPRRILNPDPQPVAQQGSMRSSLKRPYDGPESPTPSKRSRI